jgi:hypothetical protein
MMALSSNDVLHETPLQEERCGSAVLYHVKREASMVRAMSVGLSISHSSKEFHGNNRPAHQDYNRGLSVAAEKDLLL